MRGTAITETLADMDVGDHGELLVQMNVRSEIELKSEVIGSLPECCHFTVVERGTTHRALVSSGDVTGWISTKTDLDQPLTKKVKSGTGSLPVYEAVVQLNLRECMDFKSPVLMSIPGGTQFDLIEEAEQNRVKVFVDGMIGWVTAKTDLDQPLIKELSKESVLTRLSKNLESYFTRQFSDTSDYRGVPIEVYSTWGIF